ncbi:MULTISPECIES: large conductance mechanosensitive channel protein MscL [unclassified Ruminococcus]|uniref:large conductance mechanosensitive channel protein MscL n=1 Tax=unclassified Ruminococcus TaxID=2608920 RepID=UPI00210C9D8F|nr:MULTISPECIES: large conductance mechanosensitive channel protein MscL [unclassified Ruminococcus]MCQ4022176.1 large conductance mechanosensitive channel protein MscL [Ruminococcus sp. zg-924]MCQ4115574.1 large conductance mechanosensitive channel protein MscL [Ruminococcus sp. zg-921]
MKKFLNEFKAFIMRGNVLDLAVAVIIGAAFQAIISSLVDDIISPILGLFGGVDFKAFVLDINGVQIKYGSFITAVINFLIMALVIFLIIKGINKITELGKKLSKKEEEEAAPTTKICPFCCSEIDIKASRCPHCTSVLEEKDSE